MSPERDRHSHHVPPGVLAMLRPIFRYSYTIDAYVLRGVGRHVGPVLKPRAPLHRHAGRRHLSS
jgi:hypothetical protein